MAKTRLDQLLVERGLAPSRERAKALIMEGKVFADGVREDKPGTFVAPEKITSLEVRGETLPFVSRGGLKLQKATDAFGLVFDGMVCLDIGASTGGFTDCMLQGGAVKVYAIDVGYGQLDYRLRTDPRVVSMEKTNFRYVTPQDIGEEADFAAADVSFISLEKILPAAHPVLKDGARMVTLIKPQFEAGRDKVGKKGVVRDRDVHEEVILKVMRAAERIGFAVCGLTFSPVRGPEGNIEYLLLLQKKEADADVSSGGREETGADIERARAVVKEAHEALTEHT